MEDILLDIQAELNRFKNPNLDVSLDDEFEPRVGTLARVELGPVYWHLFPADFLTLLRELPDNAEEEHVRHAIERRGSHVWHGPAPPSRDT